MTKAALFDFSNASASEIVAAIDNKTTSVINLRSFRTRIGGAKKADRLFPATREALNMISKLRKQARDSKTINKILKPYSAELAKGHDVMDIIAPVLSAWRHFYAAQGIGLMNEQVLLLKMVEVAGELEALTGRAVTDMVTAD
ncbi:MAG: hypothetical protein ACOH2G_04255 [Ewingella sp.]